MPSEAETISVCIPVYNGEPYLRECLESVLAQTRPADEILILDDCSTDESPATIAAFADRATSIRHVRNERNQGLVGNWNRCLALARGDWIKFVFQDDVLEPACLERLVARVEPGLDVVACRRDFIFESPPSDALRAFYADSQRLIDAVFADRDRLTADEARRLAVDRFGHNLLGEPSSVLFRRDCVERFGAFDPALVMSCDLEYWVRVAVHGGAAFVPETLSRFRIHAGATSTENRSERQFRMETIDNLLLLRAYAHEPVYAPLRAHMARRTPPVDVEAWLRHAMHEAYAKAEAAARRESRDTSLLDELRTLYRTYPDLAISPTGHWLWRTGRRLRARLQPSSTAAG